MEQKFGHIVKENFLFEKLETDDKETDVSTIY